MLTSVIVPIYAKDPANVELAMGALRSFSEGTPENHELIVVDNASSLPNPFEDMADIYIRLDPNRGFAGGVNRGFQVARGDYLAVGSADIEVPYGWLTPMLKALERRPGLATPMEYGNIPESAKTQARRGAFFGPLWVMPREILENVGPLDETFTLAYADTAYAIEVDMAGYWVGRVPEVAIRQVAKHHALHLMDEGQLRDEYERLVGRYGHRFYGHWKAARLRGDLPRQPVG